MVTATPTPDVASGTRTSPDVPWDVVLFDDPVNLDQFVAVVLADVLQIPRSKAWELVRTVELSSRAVVWSGPKPDAEQRAVALGNAGLTVTVEPGR